MLRLLVDGAKTADFYLTGGEGGDEEGTVSVDVITYDTEGVRSGDKHLLITVTLNPAVSGAAVSIDLSRDGSPAGSVTGTTGTDGAVTFTVKNASSGCYTTEVTGVTADGLTWIVCTPTNSFGKNSTCSP